MSVKCDCFFFWLRSMQNDLLNNDVHLLSTLSMPGTVINSLHISYINTFNPEINHCYGFLFVCFVDEEIEAWKS